MKAPGTAASDERAACPGRVAAGFTLVELVVVIAALAVFAVVALLRAQPAESSTPVQADRLARDIRHMQMLAMHWGVPLRLTSTATGYSIACISATPSQCNGLSPITDPSDIGRPGGYVVALENSVTLNATSITVDALGRPCAAPCTAVANVSTATTTFTLTGGTRTASVAVRPLTGSVAVTY